MKSKLYSFLAVVLATVAVPSVGAAAVITSNGDGTFTDTITGYEWMDISTFYSKSFTDQQALLLPGFLIATSAQVTALTTDTGITSSTNSTNFHSIALAMGAPQPLISGSFQADLIWGRFGTTGVSDAFVYGPPDIGTNLGCYTAPCLNWNIRATGSQDPSVASAFLGAFAVNVNVSQTPLPAALPLFATGLGLMGLLGWRRKRKAQAAA